MGKKEDPCTELLDDIEPAVEPEDGPPDVEVVAELVQGDDRGTHQADSEASLELAEDGEASAPEVAENGEVDKKVRDVTEDAGAKMRSKMEARRAKIEAGEVGDIDPCDVGID